MYCPQCRSEYREGFTTCAPCKLELVAELPPESTFASPEAMARALADVEVQALVVGTIAGLREAQAFLQKEHIATVIAGESEEVEPGLQPRFYLMVGEADVERAKGALERRWKEGVAAHGLVMTDDAMSADACPACGAQVADGVPECPDCGLFLG